LSMENLTKNAKPLISHKPTGNKQNVPLFFNTSTKSKTIHQAQIWAQNN